MSSQNSNSKGITYPEASDAQTPRVREQDIETAFVDRLRDLKYTIRADIRDRASLEANFRQKLMTASDQQRLGKTLWAVAHQLRGAMNADDHFLGVTKVIRP